MGSGGLDCCSKRVRGYLHAVQHLTDVVLGHRLSATALVGLAALASASAASAQLRVVTYNVTDLVGNSSAISQVLAATHADDKTGYAAPVGVFMFCEVRSGSQGTLLNMVNASAPSGYTYALATFTSAPGEDGASGAQALIYRTDIVAEIPAGHMDLSTGGGRMTDRWQMRLVGYDSTAARFYVYGAHLKASTGSSNVAERLAGVQTIRANADALGASTHTLYTGDMNFYTNTESGFAAFIAAGNGQSWDPMGTANWTGAANAILHTQSPRDVTSGGLVGGGMDDRFDLILPTNEFGDGDGLSIIAGTYRAVGNDGNHYDTAINNGNNSYFPTNIGRSNTLAANLFAASDHIPVLVDFAIPGVNQAVLVAPPARVIQGAAGIVAQVRVSNAALGLPIGCSPMAYSVIGSGVVSGVASGTAPLTPSFASVNLPVATNVIGLRTGNAAAGTASEAAQNPSINLPVSLRVLRASNPSFSNAADVNATLVTADAELNGPPVVVELHVSNFGATTDQSLMDLDDALVNAPGFSIMSVTGTGIGFSTGDVEVAFDPTGFAAGTYEAPVTVFTSDEDVPGETTASVIATVRVTIAGDPCAVGDIDCNGSVDGADLGMLLSNWGLPGNTDLNGDGSTDGADLGVMLSNWG